MPSLMQEPDQINLGRYVSYWYHRSPRRMLHCLSYYKFASQLIGPSKKVLDIGCNEGLGTWLLAKECGYAKGLDFDEHAIASAQKNFSTPVIEFSVGNILKEPPGSWDAVVNFDVIEHILPENAPDFLGAVVDNLSPTGLAVIGTPSLASQQFASAISKHGHYNVYSPERLEEEMKKYFSFVFIFAGNDEIVHTGYLPLAHYLIAVGCKKKA